MKYQLWGWVQINIRNNHSFGRDWLAGFDGANLFKKRSRKYFDFSAPCISGFYLNDDSWLVKLNLFHQNINILGSFVGIGVFAIHFRKFSFKVID